jgi:hypothetical protein
MLWVAAVTSLALGPEEGLGQALPQKINWTVTRGNVGPP